jgi:hypothetical protein
VDRTPAPQSQAPAWVFWVRPSASTWFFALSASECREFDQAWEPGRSLRQGGQKPSTCCGSATKSREHRTAGTQPCWATEAPEPDSGRLGACFVFSGCFMGRAAARTGGVRTDKSLTSVIKTLVETYFRFPPIRPFNLRKRIHNLTNNVLGTVEGREE